jgi:hypothetical protein
MTLDLKKYQKLLELAGLDRPSRTFACNGETENKKGDFGVKSVIFRFSKYACVTQLKGAKAYEYWGSEGVFDNLEIHAQKVRAL